MYNINFSEKKTFNIKSKLCYKLSVKGTCHEIELKYFDKNGYFYSRSK
jgi:hypothetical protein